MWPGWKGGQEEVSDASWRNDWGKAPSTHLSARVAGASAGTAREAAASLGRRAGGGDVALAATVVAGLGRAAEAAGEATGAGTAVGTSGLRARASDVAGLTALRGGGAGGVTRQEAHAGREGDERVRTL
jgi:hypothetical protein